MGLVVTGKRLKELEAHHANALIEKQQRIGQLEELVDQLKLALAQKPEQDLLALLELCKAQDIIAGSVKINGIEVSFQFQPKPVSFDALNKAETEEERFNRIRYAHLDSYPEYTK